LYSILTFSFDLHDTRIYPDLAPFENFLDPFLLTLLEAQPQARALGRAFPQDFSKLEPPLD